jgi:glycosyltransferase involved in cell wall biosynthesis
MDYNPMMIAWLVGFIRKNQVDLVVTNIQKEVIIGGLAAKISGIPNIRRIGNQDDLNNRVRWRQKHLVDHSIVPCDFTLAEARKRLPWLDTGKFTTIHNGVNPAVYSDEEIADVRRAWGLTGDQTVVGCTSGLAAVKRIDRLIAAFMSVSPEHPEARLVLTGEGPDEARLRECVRAAGLEDRVIFAGFSGEPQRVAAAYDIAVLNSSIEGFPNVIIEYMAAGRPVISTRVGGVSEILEDGRNGIMIEPGDGPALENALRALLSNPGLRGRLGREARRSIEKGFTEDDMIERLEALFRALAGHGGGISAGGG